MVGRILCCLLFMLPSALFSQLSWTITIVDTNSQPVPEVKVEIPQWGRTGFTNYNGSVTWSLNPNERGHIRVYVLPYDFAPIDTLLNPSSGPVTLQLQYREATLDEVVVNAERESGLSALRKVEGTSIYAGKKSEVIRPDEQPANLAMNNAREVFAKVTGMNVWEGDESGIQLNIGGRGLNPNRASNFNVRQNGYDISPDALGYPESYYTPPAEAVDRIEVVKGAASLQYGTQFGGLINFVMRGAPQRNGWEVINRTTGGSFGLFNQFTSAGWRGEKTAVYAYGNFRRGDGWRPNSGFNSFNGYVQGEWNVSSTATLKAEYTHLSYLAQQGGGLDDQMFEEDPRQSNRERNWFALDWNILALHYDQHFLHSDLNIRVYGLDASRNALGFRNYRPAATDPGGARELITGDFRNAGIEARYLQRYNTSLGPWATLVGVRAYSARNSSQQGLGPDGDAPDFTYIDSEENLQSDYRYPNDNLSFFIEQLISLGTKWTITPGVRFEYINSRSDGYYRVLERDLAGGIILNETRPGGLQRERSFALAGVGIEYQVGRNTQMYFNATQNFRAITYSDIHIINPSFRIDENISDERGYSIDMGIRQHSGSRWKYDVSAFLLNYDNRIGEVALIDSAELRLISYRTNIGQALIYGLESYVSYVWLQRENSQWQAFLNTSLTRSTYLSSALPNVEGNNVEFAPLINLKGGVEGRWKGWRIRLQGTYLSEQFTDAANDVNGGYAAVTGIIPSFMVYDMGLSWQYGRWEVNGGINNLLDEAYFTRRATGYPGPGIIPSTGRSFYLGVQFRFGG